MERPPAASYSPAPIDLAEIEIRTWRQGDVFALGHYPVVMRAVTAANETGGLVGGNLEPQRLIAASRATDGAVVVVAQTCDLVKSPDKRPDTLVAPIVTLKDDELREAKAGTRPRYAHLPRLATDAFGDLDHVFPIEKAALLGRRQSAAVATTHEVLQLASAIARSFGRFAFPDEFVRAVRPLTQRLRDKYGRQSPEGEVLRSQVEEILIEADWMMAPCHPTIIVVLAEDLISASDSPTYPQPSVLGDIDSIPKVCGNLIAPDATEEDRAFLWLRLSELWAGLCETSASIGEITVEAVPEDELPYSRARRTNPLDLDYLSST